MAGTVLSGIIFGFCAAIMIGIGIAQIRSKHPVTFFSGEKALRDDQVTDVAAWNRKHGTMWILYGCCIAAAWGCGLLIGDSLLLLIPFSLGIFFPIVPMNLYHKQLILQYLR